MKEKIIEILTDLEPFISLSAIEKEVGIPDKSLRRSWQKKELPPEVLNYFTGLVQKWTIVQGRTETDVQDWTKEPAVQKMKEDLAQLQGELKSLKDGGGTMREPQNTRISSMRAFLGIQDKPKYDPTKQVKKAYKTEG